MRGRRPWFHPDDPPGTVYEFFAPFAHVEGRYEWCRIRSPTHGVFDLFIVLRNTTGDPAHVYVNGAAGEAFMKGRYAQCTTVRVAGPALRLGESRDGRRVEGRLRSPRGPVREARMVFTAPPSAIPRNISYGGRGNPIWGNPKLTCWGVDLVLDARVTGRVRFDDGRVERFRGDPALLTLGSFGRITLR